ncbi:hypothetical protein BMS3Abin15_00624 [bacterium BMS3Abin15]|nr:hypothetical protein BMS3Abin15_00624 [bacterium BMS3Abin15]HDH07409.1 hypothetical protein [Candidatus Moranbacteria bacterium]
MPKSNLEPINEKDLDLENKFKGAKKESEDDVAKIEKEKPKEVAKAKRESAYGKILSKIKSRHTKIQDNSKERVESDAKNAFENTDAESQVQQLVDVAMNKGVIHAVKVAKHIEDNYVLDMFHDKLLADELHDALIKKGLIEEIQI